MLRISSVRPAPMRPAKPTISPRRTKKLSTLADQPVGDLRVPDGPVA